MFTPAAVLATSACTWSGVAWPRAYTASRTSWRCAVRRRPRARSSPARLCPPFPAGTVSGSFAEGGGTDPSYDSVTLPGVSAERVVALLGVGVVPAETPILRADDLGALRGD